MAGGVSAGRLSIEIVAEIARLQQDLDKAKRLVNSASGDIAKSARAANDNIASMGSGFTKAAGQSRLASHQMLNLSYQVQDLGLQFAMAAQSSKPLQMGLMALFQQGSQIVGISQQTGVGIGAMAKQMAGAVGSFLAAHPAIIAVAGAAGAGALAFKGFADTLENKAPVDDYIKTLGLTAEEAKKLTDTHVTLGDAAGAAWDMIKEALGLEDVFSTVKGWVSDAAKWLYSQFKDATASVYAAFAATYDNIGLIWKNLPALLGDAVRLAANKTIEALESMVNGAITALNWLAKQSNGIFGTSFSDIKPINLADLKIQYSAAGTAAAAAWSDSFNTRKQQAMGAFDAWEDRSIANRNKRLKAQADELIKDRKDKSSKAAKDAADEAAKLAKWVEDTRAQAQGNVWKLAQDMEKRQREWGKGLVDLRAKIDAAWGDNALAGLSGSAREFAELNIEIEALRKQFSGAGMDAVALEQALEDYRAARTAGINQKTMLEKDAEAAARLLDTLGAITNMGGALGSLAGLVGGLKTGDFSRVGGGLGRILEIASPAVGEDGWKAITNKLDQIFGGKSGDGTFARSMTNVLANAAFGSTAASMTGGSKLGGAAGGVIGGKLGEKLLEKPLKDMFGEAFGSLAGPLGSMLGGVLGGVIGGMFKKVKWGAVDISSSGVSASRGNNSAAEKAAVSVGDNIMASLNQIAEAFGGGLGDFGNITVGQRHGDWRVNATGTSLKVKKGATDFNDDAEGAIAYAIQVAIERGAITGIRESTQNLLQASGDLQTKLSKALSFEGVFSDLKQATDPVGYELEELTKKFDGLRKIFAEAGATTEEYTQLEQLLSIQRKGILDQAENERRELEVRLLTAQGKAAEAANLQREIELSQTKDDLKLLMKQVQVEELASQRRSMEITLLEAMGKSTEALTLRRQAELAAMDESLRPLQRSIWYYQDAAQKVSDARDALSAAYSRESSSLQSTADKFRDFAKAISEFRASLFTDVPGVDSYALARSRFDKTANLARLGNEASLSAFTGDAQSYLDAARDRAGSALDYARDVARVARAADQAQAGANGVASMADRQLAQLTASVKSLIDLNDNVTTVWQAIADLEKAQAEEAEAQAEMDKLTNPVPQLQEVNVNLTDINGIIERLNDTQSGTKEEIAALRSELQSALIAIASNTGESARILRRADRGDALATQVEAA